MVSFIETCSRVTITHGFFTGNTTMGMPPLSRHDPGTNVTLSYYFEEACTRTTETAVKDSHPAFYTVVSRTIGELTVVMAGEVDCSNSKGTRYDRLVIDRPLTTISCRRRAQPGELHRVKDNQCSLLWRDACPVLSAVPLGGRPDAVGYHTEVKKDGKVTEEVSSLNTKTIEQVLEDARNLDDTFDPAVSLGRAYDILLKLREYLRTQKPTPKDKFVLRIDSHGNGFVTRAPNSPDGGPPQGERAPGASGSSRPT